LTSQSHVQLLSLAGEGASVQRTVGEEPFTEL